ncbi:SPX domain-containing protein 1-like isoform X2 [Cucurbita pepo subsp. pepo]|uniref:SPX domain-containing protein 1-like isoform X2 n=1 Tax=Cucurbita pepo subsp. pepo TaxID=3664 RepID=UPI000C9D979A|nr:SPX domain-containing protein 1-like isoform X2 [Cucurbita pepo subsp. pepo]
MLLFIPLLSTIFPFPFNLIDTLHPSHFQRKQHIPNIPNIPNIPHFLYAIVFFFFLYSIVWVSLIINLSDFSVILYICIMKFWKILCILIESTLPEWRDEFISYKKLKKQLKLMYPDKDGNPKRLKFDGEASMEVFLNLLEEELDKFNQFFLLQERVAEIGDSDERLMKVGRDIVDFHGEMVLLENYSALNYTGLAKILKKYDKRSGELIRVPFIKKVLRQPFYSTDVLGQLLKECETILDLLFFKKDLSSAAETVNEKGRRGGSEANTASESKEKVLNIPEDLEEIEYMESMYMKLTLSALKALKEIRGGSSTIDVFSWL